MDFGQIIAATCENVPAPSDPRCADAAFAVANPTVCPNGTGGLGGTLILKPGTALSCTLGSIQYSAVLVKNGQENPIASSITFSSSDTSVAVIAASSGNATGVGAGETIITAVYEDSTTGNILTATSSLTVLPGTNCCSEVTVAIMLCLDVSLSMSQAFGGSYSTKLNFAIAAATGFLNQIDGSNVSVGLMTFYDGADTILVAPTTNIASVISALASIQQTQNLTSYNKALADAVTALKATSADFPIIALLTDGEDTSATDTTDAADAINTSNAFQATGGIIMGLGCRANDGFLLLEGLCAGGFFINAYPAVATQALGLFNGLKGYVCAGNCTPAGNVTQPTPQLDYCNFINWWISEATVDLLGPGLYDFMPGNGLYVDMMGGTETDTTPSFITGTFFGGLMTSRNAFTLTAGHQYRLSVALAGNQIQNTTGTLQLLVFSRNSDGLANPNAVPTVTVNELGAPLATTPTYKYVYTWENANGETAASPATSVTPTNAGATMTVTPAVNPGGGKTKIYRTSGVTPTSPYYLIATVNSGQSYVDEMNEADMLAALVAGTVQPCANPPPVNTTGSTVNYLNQQVTITDYQQGFESQSFTFTAPTNLTVYISLQQVSAVPVPGLLLGEVTFTDATQIITILDDNFDGENEQYIPPACGSGSSGGYAYHGYNCYNDGCLNNTPPGTQLPDPNALPNIEAGFTPPTTYTSTQTQTASCPTGQMNLSNTPLGAVGNCTINLPGSCAWNPLENEQVTAGWYQVELTATGFTGNFTLTLQGSQDGINYTTIDTEEQLGFTNGSGTLQFIIQNPTAYFAYALSVTGAGLKVSQMVATIKLFAGGPSTVTATATATSTVSQAAADAAAIAQALANAQAQLTCVPVYTATESFTANCPAGLTGQPVTKTVTFTSLISQLDAQNNALDEAQAEAQDALSCQCVNMNSSVTTINPAASNTQPTPASPYPSVFCAKGILGTITKLTVSLTGLNLTSPVAVQFLLVSPSGQAVLFYSGCGQLNIAFNGNLTFDDAAGSNLPCGTPFSAGTFKPTVCGAPDTFPSPAPAGSPATALSAFIGENPNGTWQLYALDTQVFNSGTLASWSLNITT